MFKTLGYQTKKYYEKRQCLDDLAEYLSSCYEDIEIIDIEKEWKEDKSLSDYSPRLSLEVIIIYKEKNQE